MNELFEYGIQTEKSDVRAHVSVVNRTIYAFRTAAGLAAVKKYNPPIKTATQPGVEGVTAEGWILKVSQIPGLRSVCGDKWKHWSEFDENMTTTQKGALAVRCVCDCMAAGKFPFWIIATEEERASIQVKGTDIVVFCKTFVQVKCDWRSGPPPGTGNLFLQKAERNPLRRT
jgi:hypothetical protein